MASRGAKLSGPPAHKVICERPCNVMMALKLPVGPVVEMLRLLLLLTLLRPNDHRDVIYDGH